MPCRPCILGAAIVAALCLPANFAHATSSCGFVVGERSVQAPAALDCASFSLSHCNGQSFVNLWNQCDFAITLTSHPPIQGEALVPPGDLREAPLDEGRDLGSHQETIVVTAEGLDHDVALEWKLLVLDESYDGGGCHVAFPADAPTRGGMLLALLGLAAAVARRWPSTA